MTWRPHQREQQQERSVELSSALAGARRKGGKWAASSPYRTALAGGNNGVLKDRPASGSRGGAPIWAMAPAYEVPRGIPHVSDGAATGDPDGFAVFGRFPKGWLAHVLKLRLLGDVRREDILHVCSGTLGPQELWTVDLRPEARPRVVANGTALPFRAGSFGAALLDPPYSDQYARNLYGVENPRPAWLLTEAARVLRPGGRVGMLHVAVPCAPPGCVLVGVWGVSSGVGFRIRAFTVYQREQEALL